MKFIVLLVIVVLVLAIGVQHFRYLNTRRGPVQDRQPLLYGSSTFHAVSFLRARPGEDVLEAARKLRGELESPGRAKMIYAGRAAGLGLASSQVGEPNWDLVVFVQHRSREAYDELAQTSAYQNALARFEESYTHGMDRSVALNLSVPIVLLGRRVFDWIRRRPDCLPFVAAPADLGGSRALDRLAGLDELRTINDEAVVVVNLLKNGNAEQRANDSRYGMAMMAMFAEGGFGPMHLGRAVRVEGDAQFDRVALVYYPGIDFLQEMSRSTFFNGIVGGKQPGDTLAVPTVPVLDDL